MDFFGTTQKTVSKILDRGRRKCELAVVQTEQPAITILRSSLQFVGSVEIAKFDD
jgi:hypothetical protein